MVIACLHTIKSDRSNKGKLDRKRKFIAIKKLSLVKALENRQSRINSRIWPTLASHETTQFVNELRIKSSSPGNDRTPEERRKWPSVNDCVSSRTKLLLLLETWSGLYKARDKTLLDLEIVAFRHPYAN